jgi:hypothetical protein
MILARVRRSTGGWEMPVKTCRTCGRTFQQGRGRPSEFCEQHRARGGRYGGDHKKQRAATMAQAWGTACVRCGRVLEWGQEIHLDHRDGGGPGDYRGWAHAHCNTAAGARKGARMRSAVNGRPVRRTVPGAAQLPPSVPPGRNPHIEHRADCQCGELWTSRCW